MKLKRMLLCFLLILGLLLPGTARASASDAETIIWDLITYYSFHQDNARTDIERLLQELEALDPVQGAHWRAIMDYWHYTCTGLALTPNILPDGLPQDESLCIVVFGFALNPDGSPKEELEGRLDTALSSAKKYPNAYILCTGGGTAPGNRSVTEAGQMADWLEEKGIAPERIITEGRSYTTEQNAQFCLEILQQDYPQIRSLALVSSDYHLRRCHLLFQTLFILNDLDSDYGIAGCAAYPAGYVGESGYMIEAQGLKILTDLQGRGTRTPVLATLESITVGGPLEYTLGQFLSLTVTAHYHNGFSRDVTANAVVSGFDPETSGTQDITISYTENGSTATVSLTITITDPPTEAPTEPPATEPTETETAPTETTEPAHLQPSPGEEGGTPPWLVWVLIPIGASLPPLLLLLSTRTRRGKYQK